MRRSASHLMYEEQVLGESIRNEKIWMVCHDCCGDVIHCLMVQGVGKAGGKIGDIESTTWKDGRRNL